MTTARLDSFRIEILSNALIAIAEECQFTILRSAYSHNVKEAGDCSTAIFTNKGEVIAQAAVGPGQLGSMRFMIREVIASFPVAQMKAGDVYISNDPYRGGSHLPDIVMFRPIFSGALCVGFTGCMIHHTDVGGMTPGSNPQRATELYQEGLVIPPVKLVDAGTENTMIADMIRANVRQPHVMFGDLRAQEAALLKGETRLHEVIDRFGAETVIDAMEQLIAYGERKAREAMASIPRGSYEFEDFMDHDGIDLTRPIRIKVRLDVLEDRLLFDYTGTAPQAKGPINATLSKTWSWTICSVQCILPKDVPFNEGMMRIVDVHVPEGTILNPKHPAPVNAKSVTAQRVCDTALGALALAVPDRVGAQSCGVVAGISFGGINPRTGRNFVFYESYCGGAGGAQNFDGADAVGTGTSNPLNIPVEAVEMGYPIRIHRYELVKDSGGSGEFRGGLGIRREYEMLADTATVNVRGERSLFAPSGVHGGTNAQTSTAFLEDAQGKLNRIPSKFSGTITKGRRLLIIQPGGGGFGDPKRRSHAQLMADYLDGKMSAARILEDYGFDVTKGGDRATA